MIEGKYIVTLKPEAEVQVQVSWVNEVHKRSFAKRDTAGVEHTYDIKTFKGYAGEFDENTLAEIKANPNVRNLRRSTATAMTSQTRFTRTDNLTGCCS